MTRSFGALFIALGCFARSLAAASMLSYATYAPTTDSLVARDECPANTFQCPSDLGDVFRDICCSSGQVCALDNNNNPACCPSGAVCTGTAPGEAPTAVPTQAVSFVSNSYFSFPYAMTTFDGSAACAEAVEACSDNFEICTARLGFNEDPGFAVTIQVPGGGGVTVGGAASDLGASGTSICSSLSSEACSHLTATPCEQYGNDSGSGTAIDFLSGVSALMAALGVSVLLTV